MKPQLRPGVSLWSLLVFCALVKVSQAQCDNFCDNETVTINATTTTVTARPTTSCNFSIGNNTPENDTIDDLTPGTVYQVFFSCWNCCKNVTTQPEAVGNLTAFNVSTSSIFLRWTEPKGNWSSFRVQWTYGSTNKTEIVTATEKNIPGLTAGVQYEVTVSAVAGDGVTDGEKSSVSIYTKPEAVGNLTAFNVSTSSIFLRWTEPKGNWSSFRVQWTYGSTNKTEIVTATEKNIPGLTAGVQYEVTVSAVAGDGITDGEKSSVSIYTKPEAVGNLTAFNVSTSSIFLRWTEPKGNWSSFRVQWTNGSTNKTEIVTATEKNIPGLTAGVQYEVTVSAVAGDGVTDGEKSSVSLYTKPEAVGNLTAFNVSTSSIFLRWTKPKGNWSSFRVQWTYGSTNKTEIVTATEKNIPGLTAGVQYEVTVSAVAGDGVTDGGKSSVSIYTMPATVENLIITNVTTSSVSLSWHEPEGNVESYRVRWTDDRFMSINMTTTTIPDLTPGSKYNISVAAVVENFTTEGQSAFTSTFTKPEAVGNLTAFNVSTSSIFLRWTEPKGNWSSFRVQWTYGSTNKTEIVTATEKNIPGLTAGVQYEVTVTAVAGDGVTDGEKSSVSIYTMPATVENLIITNVTTSSVSLSWHEPEGNVESYRVRWTDDRFMSINMTTTTIPDLTPGSKYNISVAAVVENFTTEGQSAFTSTFTRPTKPGNITVMTPGTDNLDVQWTLLEGGFEHFIVNISNQELTYSNFSRTTNKTANFIKLHPGRMYVITVKAVAGKFTNSSEPSLFPTKPIPPESIKILAITNSSLHLSWDTPALLHGAPQISYLITYQSDSGEPQHKNTTSNYTNLTPLSSGTRYKITLNTVGPQNLMSVAINTSAVTLPNPVLNLIASPINSTSVEVMWSHPQDPQGNYTYLVQACNDTELVFNATVNENSTEISDLEPGTRYNISVKTIASAESESTEEQTYSYTRPEAVTGLQGKNVTTTTIQLTWVRQKDHKPTYSYLVIARQGAKVVQNYSTNAENHTFSGLNPGALYTFDVFTVVGGVNSSGSSISIPTIPTPPGPISVESQTVKSINFTWSPPEEMDNGQYNFSVSSLNGTHLTPHTWFQLDSLQSGTPYNISVVTVGVWNHSTQVTAENYTRPYSVTNLRAEEVTVDAVTLLWEQEESKSHYSYVVQVSNGSRKLECTVSNTMCMIPELFPGSNYSFTVTTQTADGTSAAPVTVSQFTKPEAVKPSISSQGSNNSVLVSWSQPRGNVKFYLVFLTLNTSEERKQCDTVNTSCLFSGLSAGRLYNAKVFTFSGPVNASSTFVSSATYPNPPGPIEILLKTTSSIGMRWTEAPLMSGASFQYRLNITSPNANALIAGNNTNHKFDSLRSGTSFNISIVTVGTLGFESEEVQIHVVTTRPFSVENLSASTEEEAITITWSKPSEYKESYRYNVTWQNSQEARSDMTDNTEYNITDLVPGTKYNFSVTTETSDGTQAVSTQISNCTDASPVTDLRCEGPNTKNAQLLLSWKVPKGQHLGFQVAVNDSEMISSTGSCCNQTVSNLLHHTVYKLRVVTLSCGRPSMPVVHVCKTGITDPPILEPNGTLVRVVQKTHKSFSLQIDSILLNDSNGPITHIGVLVATHFPSNMSDWRTYLEKNYDQFKDKKTPVYLATLREKNITQSRSGESRLNIEVGDGSRWKGYLNGALNPGENYQYAVVAFTSVSLQNNTVNGEQSLVSITVFNAPVKLFIDPAITIGIASGTTVGIFSILLLVLISFIMYWRRLSQKEQTDIQIHSMRDKVSVEVRTEDYELYYKKQKADSNCGFAEEFEDLKIVGTNQSKNNALMLENKPKNRYNNVLPYDSSRVKLSIIHGSPYDDYINANYIPGHNSRKEFIAAQGPLPGTVKDFWRMIWEKNVQTLVMLTRCNEQGRVKCEQYWDFGTKHFENINVTMTSEIPLEDWTIRDFDIKNVKTAETRTVRQFHFTAWPDHGVPETTELLIGFRHLVREHMDQYSRHSPTVVHCSAGVGRTGTFIAIDRLIFQIERENVVDVYGIVHDLRMHRALMVQTEDQYVFLNQCAMDIIRSRTGTNVDLIYQNTAALCIYENIEPKKGYHRNGYRDA